MEGLKPVQGCDCRICEKRRNDILKEDNKPVTIFTTPTSERLVRLNKTWKR